MLAGCGEPAPLTAGGQFHGAQTALDTFEICSPGSARVPARSGSRAIYSSSMTTSNLGTSRARGALLRGGILPKAMMRPSASSTRM